MKSFQLTFATCCIIIIPIRTNAGEITSIGIELINGDRNKNGKNINPAKIAVRPERAPWAIPTPDSTTTVEGLEPSMLDTIALVASARKVFLVLYLYDYALFAYFHISYIWFQYHQKDLKSRMLILLVK